MSTIHLLDLIMKNLRKSVFLAYLVVFFQISCKKDIVQPGTGVPIIVTSQVTSIVLTSAVSGGNITSDGGASVTARGVAYGTAQNPTRANRTTSNGTGIGVFTSTLSGLTASTQYYVRAYATNYVGTGYGSQVSFRTLAAGSPQQCPGTPTVTDVDNNTYNTVQIGTQCWMKSNLKVSKYRNGNNIPTGLSDSAWEYTTSGTYAISDNNPVNDGLYGKMYNHYAVTDIRGLCPTGWHVPSDGEWNILVKYLDPNADTVSVGGGSTAGGALKSTATQPTVGGWFDPNVGATNSSGFTALPGGLKVVGGGFYYNTLNGYWWSSSVSSGFNAGAWCRWLDHHSSTIYRNGNLRINGASVRCLKD